MTSKTEKDRLAFEAAIRANAVAYRVHLFLGRGQFDRADAATLAEAIEIGRRMKEAHPAAQAQPMFYAIEASGHATVITPAHFSEEINMIKTEVAPTLDETRAAEAALAAKRAKKAEAQRAYRAAKKAQAEPTPAPEAGKPDVAVTICPPAKALREISERREKIEAQADRLVAATEAERGVVETFDEAMAAGRARYGMDGKAPNFTVERIRGGKWTWGPLEAAKGAAKRPAAKKGPKAPEAKSDSKRAPSGKRAAIIEAAKAGKMPSPPDFSAPTHARFRAKLAEVVALAKKKDLAGLKAVEIKPVSSSPKAILKYRDLAIMALEAKA